jgi:hypothetical protein
VPQLFPMSVSIAAPTHSPPPVPFPSPPLHQLARLIGPRLGLNEAEAALAQALLGRSAEARRVFEAADRDRSGELSKLAFRKALEGLGVRFNDDAVAALQGRFDRNKTGRIAWSEMLTSFNKYITLTDANIAALGLERIPAAAPAQTPAFPGPSSVPASRAVPGSRLGATASSGAGAGGKSTAASGSVAAAASRRPAGGLAQAGASAIAAPPSSKRGGDGDADSVGTDDIDVGSTAQKIAKALGRKWDAVAEETKRRAEREASRAGAGAGTVSADVLRDSLAKHGVALTGKEARAMAKHYTVVPSRGVDVTKLARDMKRMGV